MFQVDNIKTQLELINSEEPNSKCFDCETQPAHWADLKNGIFLCFNCAEEHKKYNTATNSIKSITLDKFSKNQLYIMKIGGNKKLSDFLKTHPPPQEIDKFSLYNSKLLNYYRQKLKAEANEELFMEQIPCKDDYWESMHNNDENSNIFTNKETSYSENENSIYCIDMIELPQNSIIIDEDLYNIAKEKKIYEEKLDNSILYKNIDDDIIDANDPKFISISSDYNENYKNLNNKNYNSGYIGTLGNMLNSVWNTGKNATVSVANKLKEYRVGAAILYVGEKVFVGMVYVGDAILNNGMTRGIVSKAGEGLSYIKSKIIGESEDTSELEKIENNYLLSNEDKNLV